MTDLVGQRLGNYRLVRLIGKGGFAEVYLGEHVHLNTQAALKLLFTRLAGGEEIKEFQKEAQTIARLVHPNIVRVLDFDVEEDTPFLVMDYAPNGTLRARHPKGTQLAPAQILPYVSQAADALHYAHQQKLIHRDIKPENLLLDRNNDVLLSDFGIAIVAQTSHAQNTQAVVGTAAYMAPEQLQGHPHAASDQYALATVIYEWLSGNAPFQGTFTEIASQHVLAPPPSLREKVPGISPLIEEVVFTALAKDPQQRFATMQAFATAFQEASRLDASASAVSPFAFASPAAQVSTALSHEATLPVRNELFASSNPFLPTVVTPNVTPAANDLFAASNPFLPTVIIAPAAATPAPEAPPAKKPLSRRTVVLGLAGAALAGAALAGGTLAFLAVSARGKTGSQSGAQTTAASNLGNTVYVYRGHTNLAWAVDWSPNGRRIASGSVDTTVQVWDAMSGSNSIVYYGHTDRVPAVAWSPDGTRIASGSFDQTVQVWDAASGSRIYTYSGHSDHVWSVAWSPDGKRIASASKDKTVQVWDAASGALLFTYSGHTATVNSVCWSPDGALLASSSNDFSVQVWDAANASPIYTYPGHSGYVWVVRWSPNGRRLASAGNDPTVQVWDAPTGGNVYAYSGNIGGVNTVAWSPDSQRIASGGADTTVQVWNAADGSARFVYRGHAKYVNFVAWSPDGRFIASASDDTTVRVWKAVSAFLRPRAM